jgi:UDP-GlcNAc3NAcA epimerase
MKIVTVIGARPQFIKAVVVSNALKVHNIREIMVHTGQHFDSNMSDVFFKELGISPPAHYLGIGGGSHGQNTGRMIEAIERVLMDERPEWVLVYGDTDSTLAGTLAAVKLHIPVAHVEAGLRSFNRKMPEEINRVLTDHAAAILFAPTEVAVQHLEDEGIAGDTVSLVGDVMYDAALFYGQKAEMESDILDKLNLAPRSYVLGTVHRAENTDNQQRLRSILDGFADSDHSVVLPLHPRTLKQLDLFNFKLPSNVCAIDPVGYLDMLMLEKNACLIATDSGGVQKEAYFYEIPCVTLRDETEWVELVQHGWNTLAPPNNSNIGETITKMIGKSGIKANLYGNGDAAIKIVNHFQC